jgi:hypothetical protein
MGVDEQWLVDTERERHRVNYHLLLSQADITDAGPQLAQSILQAQGEVHSGPLAGLRRWAVRERTLSMLTLFLGPASMRELGLPLRPPWATAYLVVLNTWRYRLLGRTPAGRRRLDRWGDRVTARVLGQYFGDQQPDVGPLDVPDGRG